MIEGETGTEQETITKCTKKVRPGTPFPARSVPLGYFDCHNRTEWWARQKQPRDTVKAKEFSKNDINRWCNSEFQSTLTRAAKFVFGEDMCFDTLRDAINVTECLETMDTKWDTMKCMQLSGLFYIRGVVQQYKASFEDHSLEEYMRCKDVLDGNYDNLYNALRNDIMK